MNDVQKQLISLDDFMKEEIDAFNRSADKAKAYQKPKMEIYCRGVAEAYTVIRSILHTTVLQKRLADGDVLTAYVVRGAQKKK